MRVYIIADGAVKPVLVVGKGYRPPVPRQFEPDYFTRPKPLKNRRASDRCATVPLCNTTDTVQIDLASVENSWMRRCFFSDRARVNVDLHVHVLAELVEYGHKAIDRKAV